MRRHRRLTHRTARTPSPRAPSDRSRTRRRRSPRSAAATRRLAGRLRARPAAQTGAQQRPGAGPPRPAPQLARARQLSNGSAPRGDARGRTVQRQARHRVANHARGVHVAARGQRRRRHRGGDAPAARRGNGCDSGGRRAGVLLEGPSVVTSLSCATAQIRRARAELLCRGVQRRRPTGEVGSALRRQASDSGRRRRAARRARARGW